MKNYIFIYYTIFLILFNNISALHDLETDPFPDNVNSVLSMTPVLLTCIIDSRSEKILGFLFGKYLFIPKPNHENNSITSIKEIGKFNLVDHNKLILQTFPASLFEFGKEPNDDHDVYVILIKSAPFKLEEHTHYAKYFETLLSKDDFKASLKDQTTQYYTIYFNQDTNKILWGQYSFIDMEQMSLPFSYKNSFDRIMYTRVAPVFGERSEPNIITLNLRSEYRGILVVCKPENQCYINKLSVDIDGYAVIYFFNDEINSYKKLLIRDKKLKID